MSILDLFFADDGVHGVQLYSTNGSTVTSLTNFPTGGVNPSPLTIVDGVGYFLAPDGNGGFGPQFQLWRSDGTAAGTFAIGLSSDSINSAPQIAVLGNTVLYLGQDSSHQSALFESVNGQPGQFFFQPSGGTAFLGTVGAELVMEIQNNVWVTDGTAAGTHELSDGESNPAIQFAGAPVTLNGVGYFQGNDANNVNQLFKLVGGTASIVPASVVGTGAELPLTAAGRLVYISNGGELDSWDGVSSTHVKLFSEVQNNFEFTVGGKLYFDGADQANPDSPTGLFVTDGTVAGTHQVASGSFDTLVDLGSRLVLHESGGSGIFVSDGTVAGTTQIATSGSNFFAPFKVGDRAFFVVDNSQLWVTDGTVAGTHEVLGGLSFHVGMSAVGEQLLFTAAADGVNFEPWVSDGTASGTHAIANIHGTNPGSLSIVDETAFGGGMAFIGTSVAGTQMWVTNGTAAGTGAIVANVNPANIFLGSPVAAGGKLFFFNDTVNGTELSVLSSATPGAAATPIFQVGASLVFEFAFDNKLYFYAGGTQLLESDGTSAGTIVAANVGLASQPVILGSDFYFLGSDATHPAGVFKSDGTSAGTTFVAAVAGLNSSTPLIVSGSKVFFGANTAATGQELWVTDGTASGTHLVEDIAPGAASGLTSGITAFDGGVVFTANDQTHGNQVWFSNGTSAGTFQLDINQTRDPSESLLVSQEVQFGGKTYFVGNDGLHGDELYATNDTAGGTSVIAQLGTTGGPGTGTGNFAIVNNKLVFKDLGNLWVTDGTTAGTTELAPTGNLEQAVDGLQLVNGKVYFTGSIAGQAAFDLFVTDGTSAGTHDLGTLAQNAEFTAAGTGLFFHTSDPTNGVGLSTYNTTTGTRTFLHAMAQNDAYVVKVGSQIEVGTPGNGAPGANLWVTDGTAGGTVELTNFASNVATTNFTALSGDVYFSTFGGDNGFWVTNGTAAGTHEIHSNLQIVSDSFEVIGGNLFFQAIDAGVQRVFFYVPSTQVLTEVATQSVGSPPVDVTPVGTGVFFVASDATSQNELWHATNTGAATELTSPSNGQVSGPLAVVGSTLFYAGADSVHGQGLFTSNGSSVTFVAQVNDATNFSVVGTKLYFQGSDATNGEELWVSDGTAAGTHRVTDTEAPGDAGAAGFTTVGTKMFFAANDGVHGEELWAFNGQAGGATMVTDLRPGALGSNPTQLVAMGSDLYFVASNDGNATELWRSDGTAAGTVAVSTAADGAAPQDLTVVGSELFYFGSDSAHGAGLFVTNGTAAPTFVKAFANITDVSVQNGKLFFQGTDASGSELWVSNGTAAGTLKLSSTGINPGSNPTGPGSLGNDFTPRQDFNDDSRTDFLVRNTSGAVVVGEWAHNQTHLTVVSGLGSEWSFEGNADFLGDGHQDFLVENSNGAIVVGDVTGGQTTLTDVGGLGKEWSFKGVGDFTGLGRSQFLIENTAGAVVVGSVANGHATYAQVSGLGSEWKFIGTGDFVGDGRDDFLIQNSSGAVAIGEVLNGQAKYTMAIGLGSEWKFVGTGDFLGEGHDQFLIENSSGAVVVGDFEGGQTHLTEIAGLGPEWKFVGDGDFLGDGHDQFLIENSSGAIVAGDWLNGAIHFTQIAGLGSEWTFH